MRAASEVEKELWQRRLPAICEVRAQAADSAQNHAHLIVFPCDSGGFAAFPALQSQPVSCLRTDHGQQDGTLSAGKASELDGFVQIEHVPIVVCLARSAQTAGET
jgi:hypothetical protein